MYVRLIARPSKFSCYLFIHQLLLRPEALRLESPPKPGSKALNNLKLMATLIVRLTSDVYNHKLDKDKRVVRARCSHCDSRSNHSLERGGGMLGISWQDPDINNK